VVREAAPGETIRLRQDLWAEAAREQEQRRQDDGWEEPLLNAIGDSEVVPARVIWEVLGVFGASASNNTHAARVSEIMERNGYVRPKGGVHRVDGKPQRCWIKSTSPLFGEADSVADALKRPTFVPKVNEG
jgi:hypothetical protein